MVEQNVSTRQSDSEKNGSGIDKRLPKLIFTCWNESAHSSRSLIRFSSIGYLKPCPVCGTTHKLTHRVERNKGEN